ncbi:glycosyltransferase [Oscillatoriales cyanobacterium LEGE 11467]|uniref:Glycosyltransferase n=1 Tax=Zarconia navalis LEGE 11467 TaxID=1828826 RepID=A0A928W261_9CYAN|nr:glycosyltransferase [Zarconia navalis]MBE9042553.1 glycosyltransferase [Zarconia navalis LEGE 11467]
MRTLYFLVPGTTSKFGGGGLWAELKTVNLARQICTAEIVTYRQREPDRLFLADLLARRDADECIFVVSWGFDVPKLVAQLGNRKTIYHAHSTGYGFNLPPQIPIVAVSRNTMGYWGGRSPNALIYYLPNQIGDEFCHRDKPRDIDVLVQVRKSSEYLLEQLVPALQQHCRVELLTGFVEDIAELFNRSKIYLYDSAQYWGVSGVSEGFGLPPLEALACGCQVFSSVNSGLADYLDPGFNCHKIAGFDRQYDVERILAVLNSPDRPLLPESFFEPYREENLVRRLRVILTEINTFFDRRGEFESPIAGLSRWRLRKLWMMRSLAKVRKKLNKIGYSGYQSVEVQSFWFSGMGNGHFDRLSNQEWGMGNRK